MGERGSEARSVTYRGLPVSPGAARGPACVIDGRLVLETALEAAPLGSAFEEAERLRAARSRAAAQLHSVERQLQARGYWDDANIFASHNLLLSDQGLARRIEAEIHAHGLSAEAAVARVTFEIERQFLERNSSLLHDKTTDLLDVGQRLLRCLIGSAGNMGVEGSVLVAESVTPSELVRAALQGAVACVTAACGPKSHTAILARGLALPMVTGIAQVGEIAAGADLLVDGEGARVVENPTAAQIASAGAAPGRRQARPPGEPITADGTRITVLLNISGSSDAAAVRALGADGVGLYRTEFYYMERTSWPTEEEAFTALDDVSRLIGDRELNVRLVDFGAEKCPSYADIPVGRNPALGIRGLRLLLARPDIRTPQVRALARLARERQLTVLLPMVDSVASLDAAIECLRRDCGYGPAKELPFRLGTMIEVPSAALQIEEIIERVDSIAVGLNDLTQYLLAADRDDEMVESYHDARQPAVLNVVRRIVEVADGRGKPVTMCGELAGDPSLCRILAELGVRRFSVSQSHYESTVVRLRSLQLGRADQELEQARPGVVAAARRARHAPMSAPPRSPAKPR